MIIVERVNIESPIKERAKACGLRNCNGAFPHEGRFYCGFNDGKASCALDEKRIITKTWYSAGTGETTTTEFYHVCGVRKIEGVENGRERR